MPQLKTTSATKPLDRRVRRTRKLLSDSLLQLMLKQDYDSITIQDITENADLNRATFYLHYGTKEELLVAALEVRFDELVTHIEATWEENQGWSDVNDIQLIYEHAAANAPLYKMLLGDRGRSYVINRIINYIAAADRRSFHESYGDLSGLPIPVELVSQHMAGSLYSMLSWWVMNDMPHSAEYMASVTQRLCLNGIFPIFKDIPEFVAAVS